MSENRKSILFLVGLFLAIALFYGTWVAMGSPTGHVTRVLGIATMR
jgi:hypothetical protein